MTNFTFLGKSLKINFFLKIKKVDVIDCKPRLDPASQSTLHLWNFNFRKKVAREN